MDDGSLHSAGTLKRFIQGALRRLRRHRFNCEFARANPQLHRLVGIGPPVEDNLKEGASSGYEARVT
jgi:hypothetical protein